VACYVFPATVGLVCWLTNPLSMADLRALKNDWQAKNNRGDCGDS